MYFNLSQVLACMLLFLLCGGKAFTQNKPEGNSPRNFYEERANRFLLKKPVSDYSKLRFSDEGIFLYRDSLRDDTGVNPYFIHWESLPLLERDFKLLPFDSLYHYFLTGKEPPFCKDDGRNGLLSGRKIKIALSPGHLATNFEEAKYEKKYIEFSDGRTKFYEADLNLRTALILEKKLKRRGFDVFLTRTEERPDSWGLGFEKWREQRFDTTLEEALKKGDLTEEQVKWFREEATKPQVFKYLYVKYELRERAAAINRYDPDITLMIHYNVDEKNDGWKVPTEKNFTMTFVPGSFLENELEKPQDQFEFLRLLVTDNIERSMSLCSGFISSFHMATGIPIAEEKDAIYLETASLATPEEGVFSRNLAMTRLVHSPMLYGEPLYQDNRKMARSLNWMNPDWIIKITPRYVRKTARSYYKSILDYFEGFRATSLASDRTE